MLFLVTWAGQFFTQLTEVANNAKEHGQQFMWSEFWPEFLSATFENWQSEFLQLASFVILSAYLIYRGSSESKDSDDRLESKVDYLLEQQGKDPSDF